MLQYLKSFTFEDTLNQTIPLEQYASTQRISSRRRNRRRHFFFLLCIEVNIGLWVGTPSPSLPRKLLSNMLKSKIQKISNPGLSFSFIYEGFPGCHRSLFNSKASRMPQTAKF